MQIGPYSFDEYAEVVRSFHGGRSPGVMIGGIMVEMARQRLPGGILYEALCETRLCLPDAIQLLTPCTTGNGRLRLAHAGRFALALHDKSTGEGIRAYIDPSKLDSVPTIRTWFLKLVPKSEQDSDKLFSEIRDMGADIVGTCPVLVDRAFFHRSPLGPVAPCPRCGEFYPTKSGDMCLACSGGLPYLPPRNPPEISGTPS